MTSRSNGHRAQICQNVRRSLKTDFLPRTGAGIKIETVKTRRLETEKQTWGNQRVKMDSKVTKSNWTVKLQSPKSENKSAKRAAFHYEFPKPKLDSKVTKLKMDSKVTMLQLDRKVTQPSLPK